jgi:hypothetical protein
MKKSIVLIFAVTVASIASFADLPIYLNIPDGGLEQINGSTKYLIPTFYQLQTCAPKGEYLYPVQGNLNSPEYSLFFMLRGKKFAQLMEYQEAIRNFTKAICMDEDYRSSGYFVRAMAQLV